MPLRRSSLRQTEDIDPTSSASNLTDVMLVLAVGFLIFAIMASGADLSSSDIQQNFEQSAQQQAQTTELDDQTTPLDDVPENITSSGSGYQEMGKVYQDPNSGKMVMVSS